MLTRVARSCEYIARESGQVVSSKKVQKSLARKTDIQRFLAINDEVFQRLPSDTDANSAYFLAAHLYFNLARMVDKYAIVPVCDVERDAFVRLLAGGATISVPHANSLTYSCSIQDSDAKKWLSPFLTNAPNCSPRP